MNKTEYRDAIKTINELLEDMEHCMEMSPIVIMRDLKEIMQIIDGMTNENSNLHYEVGEMMGGMEDV